MVRARSTEAEADRPATSSERPARYPIQAVEKALAILQVLSENADRPAMGITEIADRIGVSKSTTHRLVATLAQHNFVARQGPAGRYQLGWAFHQAAQRQAQDNGTRELALPLMQQVCGTLGETVNLGVRHGAHLIIVESQEVPTGLKVETPTGVPQPLYNSALGKALLMDMDRSAVRQLLGPGPYAAHASRTITSFGELWTNLEACRAQGYALDDEEAIDDVRCVGAPVRDYRQEIVAAVSVTGPRQRLDDDKLRVTAAAVRQLSLDVSRRMGFSGSSTV